MALEDDIAAVVAAWQSNFRTTSPGARWLVSSGPSDARVCATTAIGFIASFQVVLRQGLPAPWTSYDGRHTQRAPVDGNWGPITNAAAYAYAQTRTGVPQAVLDALKTAGRAKTITLDTLRAALWLTYYAPRHVDLEVSGEHQVREDPPILGQVPLDQIKLPAGTVPPRWNVRPELPSEFGGYSAVKPECIPVALPEVVLGHLTPEVRPQKKKGSVWGWLLLVLVGIGASKGGR